jgi:autotransporter-associated beta strand protein
MKMTKFKHRWAVAGAGLLAAARAAQASPLFNIEVLGSTSQDGTYSSTLPSVAPGTTIYFKVVGQSAAANTTNANTTFEPNGTSDSITSLPTFAISDGNGTFDSSSLGALDGGTGANAGTTGSNSLTIRAIAGSRVADDSQLVIDSGSFTTGSANAVVTPVDLLTIGGTVSGSIAPAGHPIFVYSSETSSAPYLSFAPLTFGSSLTWDGAALNGSWDKTSVNFSGSAYSDTSVVVFGDTAANGTTAVQYTNPISIVSAGVLPASVTFTNNAVTYRFTTAGTIGIGGGGSVAIDGGGTVIFSSTNSYSGGTYINVGTLKAAAGSLLSTGAVTIGANGKLYVGDGVTNPNTPGTLVTGAQTWVAGGTYLPKVDGGSASADLLSGGALTLPASGTGAFTIAPQSDGNLPGQTAETWEIASFSSVTNFVGTLPTNNGQSSPVSSEQFALDTSALGLPSTEFSLSLTDVSGRDELELTYTPTPEPGTGLLIVYGAATMLRRRRRKSRGIPRRQVARLRAGATPVPPASPPYSARLVKPIATAQ